MYSRFKSLHPTIDNITDEQVPIPIESAFFLEDGQQDKDKFNRYYFNFPPEWCTANRGESIIGVRNMWLISKRRKLEFTITIAKYKKQSFNEVEGANTNTKIINMLSMQGYKDNLEIRDFVVVDWISTEGDFRGFFDAIDKSIKWNISNVWKNTKINFVQNDYIIDRDIQSDGYFDKNGFHEKIFSPRNENEDDEFGIALKLKKTNQDFDEVFNIGDGPHQNKKHVYLNQFDDVLTFDNVWDRHSCKVYSSIAEQSLHNYIGNSNVDFVPIKYYKLNSSDQRFWIEFYSCREYNTPIKIPDNESFCIEMQFLPFDKMLYT